MTDPHSLPPTDPAKLVATATARRLSRFRMFAATLGAIIAAMLAVTVMSFRSKTSEVVISSGSDVVHVTQGGGGMSLGAALVGTLIVTLGVVMLAAMRRRRSAASVIGAISDLSAVGAFAEALHHEDRYVRIEAEEALVAMLPRMTSADAGLLNEKQRACLHRVIRPPRRASEATLAVAAIGALTEIADARALPHVTRIVEEPARGQHQQQVRAFAEERLPVLKQRVEAAKLARTLVRPAEAPGRVGHAPAPRRSRAVRAC